MKRLFIVNDPVIGVNDCLAATTGSAADWNKGATVFSEFAAVIYCLSN